MSNDEQRSDPAAAGWQAGATFFNESGGQPAVAAGARGSALGTDEGDTHPPASESGTPMIPEDEGDGGDVHLPASEADSGGFADEGRPEPQSWPGKGGPGTFPPPG